MANLKFQLVTNDDGTEQTLTLFHDGQVLVASDTHPNWEEIRSGVLRGDADVTPLFDMGRALALKYSKLSERVSVRAGKVCFDGDEIHNSISQKIVQAMKDGLTDHAPLVSFIEKVYTNPQEDSREQLFTWLDRGIFSITPEGDLIAYKSVAQSTQEGFDYQSVTQGYEDVTVDGEIYRGNIPQNLGSVVEMPRSKVNYDPYADCSVGLHVATFEYARTWTSRATAILMVVVNPRDVVSVPRDSLAQKVRVCRYTVVKEVIDPEGATIYDPASESQKEFKPGDRVTLVGERWYFSDRMPVDDLVTLYGRTLGEEGIVVAHEDEDSELAKVNVRVKFGTLELLVAPESLDHVQPEDDFEDDEDVEGDEDCYDDDNEDNAY